MNFQHLLALQSGGGMSLITLAPLLFIFAIFYFLLIMQQQRRQMLSELKTGDKVATSGGLRGTIVAIKDDSLHLRVPPDNLRLEVTRWSVVSVSNDEPAK